MSTERKVKNDQIEEIYPLTPMQEGLLYESLVQKDRDDHPYVIQSRYDISANLQVEHFKNSWQKIVGRHQLLRTAFAYEKAKKPVQVVLRHRPVPFKLMEMDAVPNETTDQIAIRDLNKGFDLQKDPLMRITLIRMADGSYHMIWTHHHIIMDGWSLSIIERELFELYHAAISNRPDSLAPAVPVRNYINWLQSKERNESVDFWSSYLESFEKITPITIRKVSGLKGKKNTLYKNFILPDDLRDTLHVVAGNSGVTLSTLMQTVWGILLSYYNNSYDVLFGSVVSGRPPHLAGSQEMVGIFINVIPVRLRLNPDQTLKELISEMQSHFIDSQDYHDAPLAEVMSRIERRELFDHLVTFENHPANTDGDADEIGISISPYEAHDITHYPFGLKISALKNIHLQYSWNTDLFDEKRIESIHSHYKTLLYRVVEDLEQPVRSLTPMSENERAEILQLSKGPELSIKEVPDFLEMFWNQVQRNGESVACKDSETTLSYRELDLKSNQLAQFLTKQDLKPESRIAIEMDRNVDLVVSILAILKMNCSYVPIDPVLPEERKKELKACAKVSFTISEDLHDFSSNAILDSESKQISVNPATEAYLIFTSGSTGKPKGVMISRASLSHYIQTIKETILQEEGGNMALFSSVAFDMTITTLFAPLATGKTLFLFEQHTPPHLALKKIFTPGVGIDTVKMTPSHIELLDSLRVGKTDVKRIIAGGEALLDRHVKAIRKISKSIQIFNEYGPTEATVGSSVSKISDNSPRISIGKPMAGTLHYVLDRHRRLLPVGSEGELYIGGKGLALGYLDLPELTDEKFLRVHSLPESSLLYRTGDRVRWNEDGELEYIGRLDRQVKIRGHRIEPGEIEGVMQEIPLIKKAYVKSIHNDNETSLAAYYLCETDITPANFKDQLLTVLHQKLPEPMVPQHLIQIDEVPLNSNGKVDYNLLSEISGTHRPNQYEKPANELEKELQEIWSEVLNLQEISVHDHFFRIGGHSLKAMQVVNRIGNKLKIKVGLTELNEEPTIRGLAKRISKKETGEGTEIPKATEESDYPLSYAQQRLWLLHNMDAESAYNMPLTYKVQEQIELHSLKKAFKELIQRHEILRTAFLLINGEPRQKIEDDAEIEITVKDFCDEENPIMAARLYCEKQAQVPFDLNHPPLLRCILIRTDEQEYILQLCIHHIIGDGWSTRVLFNELIALYESFRSGQTKRLPKNRVQYRDFTTWQLNKDFSKDRTFWLKYMEGASEKVYLPYDRSPAAKRKFLGRYIGTTLEKEIFSGLKKISADKETTPSTVLLSLFALLLFKLTGQNDFPIAISSAGRNNRDLEQMIGFFVNILPLRVQINDQMDFDELLDTMIQSSGMVYSHQEYPFNKLVEDLNPDRAGAGQSLSNVVFGYQNYADVHLDSDSEAHSSLQKAEGFELQNNTAKFDITLFAFEKGSELQLDIEYDSELFDEKTIQSYLDTLKSFAKMVTSEYE